MAEQSVRKSLYDFIGAQLQEVAWRRGYPINPSIGLYGFFEAFRDNCFSVRHYSRDKTASFRVKWHKKLFETTLSHDEIISGWRNKFPCSVGSFYDSISIVYEKMGECLKSVDEGDKWDLFRNANRVAVRKKMEEFWRPYFMAHHEHMFLPLSMEVPNLEKPVLFDEVISQYPMHLHEKVMIWDLERQEFRCRPCSHTLPESDPDRFDEYYHPSNTNMLEYFFGIYLHGFAEAKGYAMYHSSAKSKEERIKSLIVNGDYGLEGADKSWRNLRAAKSQQ